MFLHGHFTRPEDLEDTPRTAYGARTAADEFVQPLGNRAASAAWFGRDRSRASTPVVSSATREIQPKRTTQTRSPRRQQTGFLDHLLYLGGRPMHAGHNLDIEEPFEQLTLEAKIARNDRRNAQNRTAPCATQTQTCTG